MKELISDYERILAGVQSEYFDLTQDKYSGVFLPLPYEEYWGSHPKVMLVGRETARWNTKNGKNTIRRVIKANERGATREIVSEAVNRYSNHLELRASGRVVTKTSSRFKQYYFRLARELDLDPKALVYANLFAWDYDGRSPIDRPAGELSEVVRLSNQLLAAQIKQLKPHFIIFATGYAQIDRIIRSLFNDHFDGYVNVDPVIPRKLWEFHGGGSVCFRIAHPRATHGHGEYRGEVIARVKRSLENALPAQDTAI